VNSSAIRTTLASFAVAAVAASGVAMAQQYTKNQGYLVDQNYNVVMAIGAGVCIRTSDWTPALAARAEACKQCTPDLCPKPPAPKPAAKPEAKPEAKPKPATPEIMNIEQKIELQGIEFDKVPLTEQNKKDLDEWLTKDLKGVKLGAMVVTGHTDAIGSLKYNQTLSENRAKYAKDYLVSKGIDQKLIFWEGKAFKQPVPVTKFCDPKKMSRKQLIECYAPNRRVTVEAVGTKEKPAPKPKPEAKPEAKK